MMGNPWNIQRPPTKPPLQKIPPFKGQPLKKKDDFVSLSDSDSDIEITKIKKKSKLKVTPRTKPECSGVIVID